MSHSEINVWPYSSSLWVDFSFYSSLKVNIRNLVHRRKSFFQRTMCKIPCDQLLKKKCISMFLYSFMIVLIYEKFVTIQVQSSKVPSSGLQSLRLFSYFWLMALNSLYYVLKTYEPWTLNLPTWTVTKIHIKVKGQIVLFHILPSIKSWIFISCFVNLFHSIETNLKGESYTKHVILNCLVKISYITKLRYICSITRCGYLLWKKKMLVCLLK